MYLLFDSGPSAIVRARVFADAYRDAGYKVRYFGLYARWIVPIIVLGERYRLLASLRAVGHGLQRIARTVKKWYALWVIGRYDAVIVVKWCSPGFLRQLKRRIRTGKTRILYDFDDAMWLDAFVGETAFAELIAAADCVSCDNALLATRARRYNDQVFVLDGPPQVEQFAAYRRRCTRGERPICMGWIGSPSTLFYLYAVIEGLEEVGRRFAGTELVLVGTGFQPAMVPSFENLKVRRIPRYDQADMIRLVSDFDIGLYPLFNDAMSLGRGTLKARIYMSAGVPVVASRLGENIHLIDHGETGFLASSKEDWIDALATLIQDDPLRRRMGSRAQEAMKERFTVASCFRQLEERFLRGLA